jgi:hypothetical protein
MRKFMASALAAVTAAGAIAATATPAAAAPHYYYRHHDRHHGHGDAAAAAVVAGIAGLAIGAALSDGDHDRGRSYSSRGYYDRGYYSGYGYDPRYDSYYDYRRPYRMCTMRERVWDPYIERRVTIERRYPC